MINYLTVAVAGPEGSPAQPSALLQFLPLVFLFVVFYFLLIRPQQKKQKEHANMLAKLDKNDEVITAGGIHATVISVGDKTATGRHTGNCKKTRQKKKNKHKTK